MVIIDHEIVLNAECLLHACMVLNLQGSVLNCFLCGVVSLSLSVEQSEVCPSSVEVCNENSKIGKFSGRSTDS